MHMQDGFQPLHLAAMRGNIDVAEYLVVECGIPVEVAGQVMNTVT